jgi:aldehyde:ferredoxin oxidoreductase
MRDIVNGVTGWNLSIEALEKVGERAMDMARAFNALQGLTAEDDQTAPRFTTGFTFGPREGQHIDPEELQKSKQEYYQKMGWDEKLAIPTKAKLEELRISWVADKLAEYNKLP